MGNRERKGMLLNQESELEVFKRKIDLRQFAISLGYEMDRRESWRGSTVLRCGDDKIVVKRNGNGHFVFFSVRDSATGGADVGSQVRSALGSPPGCADSSLRDPDSRPLCKSGKGLFVGCAVMRSIFVWIVIAYLSRPMERVTIWSVWIGAVAGVGKRSSFDTSDIVRQRVYIFKCRFRWGVETPPYRRRL